MSESDSAPVESATALPRAFRFRPRFRILAGAAVLLGALFVAAGLLFITDSASSYATIGGAIGLLVGGLYLLSPAWQLNVVVDTQALTVKRRQKERFRLPWDQIERVIASAQTQTCFVNGGDPTRSLLVPGHGANASYDIEEKAALYEIIVARVPQERIEWVELLEHANKAA